MPAKFEYKPLAMELFAAPLAKMQENYDITKSALEDADFGIESLSTIPGEKERVSKIGQEFRTAQEELIANLGKTKNYAQAAQKLKELNKTYNKDPEIQAIRSQKVEFAAADKEMQDRVKAGKNTETEHQDWRFKALTELSEKGGTAFNRATGQHNQINTNLRSENLEKEIMEKAEKLAKGAPVQYKEFYGDALTDPELEKIKLQEKDLFKITNEIAAHLRNSKRYKDWANEEKEYEYFKTSRNTPGGLEKFNENTILEYDTALGESEKVLTNFIKKNPNTAESADAIKQLEDVQNQRYNELGPAYEQHSKAGSLDQLAKSIFMTDPASKLTDIAGSASDIFDYRKQEVDLYNQDGDGPGAKPSKEETDAIEGIEKYITSKTNTPATTKNVTTIGGGAAAGTSDIDFQNKELKGYDFLQAINKIKNTDVTKIGERGINILKDLGTSAEVVDKFKSTTTLTNQLFGLKTQVSIYDKEKADLRKQLEDIKISIEEGKATDTEGEARQKLSEKERIAGDITEHDLSTSTALFELNAIISKSPNSTFKDVYYEKGLEGALDYAYNENLKKLQNVVADRKSNEKVPRSENMSDPINLGTTPFPEFVSPYPADDPALSLPENLLAKEDLPGELIMKRYKKSLDEKFDVSLEVVNIDEGTQEMTKMPGQTDNMFTKLTDGIKADPIGFVKTVKYDIATGTTTPTRNKKGEETPLNFSLDSYKTELKDIDYVGTEVEMGSDGNMAYSPIVSYTLLSKYAIGEAGDAAISTLLKKERQTKYASTDNEYKRPSTKEEIAAWRKNNPSQLTLKAPGTSLNIITPIVRTYTELGYQAAQVLKKSESGANDKYWKSDEGIRKTQEAEYALNTMLDSYVSLEIPSSTELREIYMKTAANLGKARKNESSNIKVTQAPAAWMENSDGSHTGYVLNYYYESDPKVKEIVYDVIKVTRREGEEDFFEPVLSQSPVLGNLVSTLRKNDLIFGTGREVDLIQDPVSLGAPFVPAFIHKY